MQRHEAFRTYFDIIDGDIVQKLENEVDFNVHVRTMSRDEFDAYSEGFVKPFRLDQAPLVRAELIKIENEHRTAHRYASYHFGRLFRQHPDK